MAIIRTKVEPPFELIAQTSPRVSAEADHVVVWLEVKSLTDPSDHRNLKIALDSRSAATLGFELIENAKELG
jgi:hypothetical protein